MWIEFGAIVSALILLGAILTGYANIMSRIKGIEVNQEGYERISQIHEEAVKELKEAEEKRAEIFRKENREEHQLLFKKLDLIVDKINCNN